MKRSRKKRRLYFEFYGLAGKETLTRDELAKLTSLRVELKWEKPTRPRSKADLKRLDELAKRLIAEFRAESSNNTTTE